MALVAALCMCGGGATATEPAVRMDPPAPVVDTVPLLWSTDSANGRCVGMEWALEHWSPGWDVTRMSRIMYRESRCTPGVTVATADQRVCCSSFESIAVARSPDG